MKNKWMTELCTALLVLLFIYTGASKLADFAAFERSIHKQHLAGWVSQGIIWLLPATEIITGLLMAFGRSRGLGLRIAMGLLILFTAYIAGILLHFFARVPCPCGGIIRTFNWQQHLFFNVVFLVINTAALWTHQQVPRSIKRNS